MEIKIKTLQVLYIVSWIIFVGVCIDAGGIVFNTVYTLFINPAGAGHFYLKNDLSSLYNYDRGYFAVITSIMSIIAVAKATMFYLLVTFLHKDKLDTKQPFSEGLKRLVFLLSYLALVTGIFNKMGINYAKWLTSNGVIMPPIQDLNFSGADVWLFMSVILFVIAQIFKRGFEIQTENALTI